MKPKKFEKRFQKLFDKLADDKVDKGLQIAGELIDEYVILYNRMKRLEDMIGARLIDGDK